MKMEALTTFMKDQTDIKKVYLINQNYSHGQQVAKFAKENLARKRPDIEIVGDDLHPLGQVRDFAPYIAKIKAVGRRHGDHRQLGLRPGAAGQGGATTPATTASSTPTTPASPARRRRSARSGAGKVYQVAYGHYNMGGEIGKLRRRVQEEVQRRLLHRLASTRILAMLAEAMAQGQVDRPGQGRRGDGRHEVQELQRRRRDAQDRPPAAAAAVHDACGRRPTRSTRTAPRTPATRWRRCKYLEPYVVEHADQLPDEAARRPERSLRRLTGRGPSVDARAFFFSTDPERLTNAWNSSPSRC